MCLPMHMCWVALSEIEQLFIRNVWAEEITQMIITAISGSLKTEKNNRLAEMQYTHTRAHTHLPAFDKLVIIKLLLITQDNIIMKTKRNITSNYNMSVRQNHWPTHQILPVQPVWFHTLWLKDTHRQHPEQVQNSCSSKGVEKNNNLTIKSNNIKDLTR